MADESVVEEESSGENASVKKGRKKAILLVAALMLAEGIGLFVLMSVLAPTPDTSLAEEGGSVSDEETALNRHVEVMLCEVDAANRKDGRTYVFHMQISALVPVEHQERIERFVVARKMSISDRIQTVIRAADPRHLSEPSLETIRRQLTFEIKQLFGDEDDVIKEVLIPQLLQTRGGV